MSYDGDSTVTLDHTVEKPAPAEMRLMIDARFHFSYLLSQTKTGLCLFSYVSPLYSQAASEHDNVAHTAVCNLFSLKYGNYAYV